MNYVHDQNGDKRLFRIPKEFNYVPDQKGGNGYSKSKFVCRENKELERGCEDMDASVDSG